jgi:dUTP pyrophosphatase
MKVFKLHDDAVLPTIKHLGDAGMDLYAYDNWVVREHGSQVIATGVGVVVPPNHVGLIKPKSRNNYLIGAGIVDSNYRGELLIKVFNPYPSSFTIEHGQPVAQIVFIKSAEPIIEIVSKDDIDPTNRGATGGIVDQRINRWD